MENSKQEPKKIDVYKDYHREIVKVWNIIEKAPKFLEMVEMDEDNLTPEEIRTQQTIINARIKAIEKKAIARLNMTADRKRPSSSLTE